jgi:hypothetical protein
MQRETSNAVVHELERQVAAVRSGDLGRGEDMLVARAHCLDELFSNLARRGFANINAGHVGAGETYLRLAFKAPSQCRSTWEALAEIKNPRAVAFVRRANIAHGSQQVNNAAAGKQPSRVKNSEIPQSKILEAIKGERQS